MTASLGKILPLTCMFGARTVSVLIVVYTVAWIDHTSLAPPLSMQRSTISMLALLCAYRSRPWQARMADPLSPKLTDEWHDFGHFPRTGPLLGDVHSRICRCFEKLGSTTGQTNKTQPTSTKGKDTRARNCSDTEKKSSTQTEEAEQKEHLIEATKQKEHLVEPTHMSTTSTNMYERRNRTTVLRKRTSPCQETNQKAKVNYK